MAASAFPDNTEADSSGVTESHARKGGGEEWLHEKEASGKLKHMPIH